MCLTYLFDRCREGEEDCPYSHDKTYISKRMLLDTNALNDISAALQISYKKYVPEAIEGMAPMIGIYPLSKLWIPRLRDEYMEMVKEESREQIENLKSQVSDAADHEHAG